MELLDLAEVAELSLWFFFALTRFALGLGLAESGFDCGPISGGISEDDSTQHDDEEEEQELDDGDFLFIVSPTPFLSTLGFGRGLRLSL